MASSSSAVPASLSIPVSEKLTRDNYRLWCAQVLSAIRAAQLEGFIDDSEKASEKILEVEKDSKKLTVATQTMRSGAFVTSTFSRTWSRLSHERYWWVLPTIQPRQTCGRRSARRLPLSHVRMFFTLATNWLQPERVINPLRRTSPQCMGILMR
jgi:hypothetical protein